MEYDESHELCYVARLQNSLKPNSGFMHLDFWRSELASGLPISQVMKPAPLGGIKWQHVLPVSWFRGLAYDVLDRWLEGCGTHIKRDRHKVCRLTFQKTSICFEFDKDGKGFAISETQEFASAAPSAGTIVAYFLTKDLIPALRGISDLDMLADVSLAVTEEVLSIEYATEAAEYSVIVLRTTESGSRCEKSFLAYTPAQFTSFETEHKITDDTEVYE